ncbi:uncharacterized protein [Bemisia tabaci]|uniref:uncharacterized protein isoform X1 n=1 Tax=Bemisia tabaci TaxID=7038 RepID=UPI003B28291C
METLSAFFPNAIFRNGSFFQKAPQFFNLFRPKRKSLGWAVLIHHCIICRSLLNCVDQRLPPSERAALMVAEEKPLPDTLMNQCERQALLSKNTIRRHSAYACLSTASSSSSSVLPASLYDADGTMSPPVNPGSRNQMQYGAASEHCVRDLSQPSRPPPPLPPPRSFLPNSAV